MTFKSRETFPRWLLAFSLCWINMTNGWQWISYASISDFTAQYYGVPFNMVNWVSLLYAVIMTVGAIPFIWFIDRYGIRLTLTISSILNLLCGLIHVISSSPFIGSDHRYMILIMGSISGGFAQPLCLFSSTKLAASWFPPDSRVSANTLSAMGNPIGVLISNILSPIIVKGQNDLPFLNLINLFPPAIGLVLVVVSVYFAPKPANSYITPLGLSLVNQLKVCVSNLQFLILVTCFGILLGMFTTISTLIQQILCPLGYSDLFSGLCGALFLATGIPGVLIVGPIVTWTKALKEVVKWGILLTTIGMITFSIVSTLHDQHILIALSLSLMGLVGFGVYPSTLELSAETAHPAGEVISTGILIAISQVLSLLFITLSQVMAVPAPHLTQVSKCSLKDVRSYWIANVVLAVICVINSSIFLFIFTTDYKRVISEVEWSDQRDVKLPLVEGAEE